MQNLSVFSFAERNPVRITTLNDEPWFVARDVASCLDYPKSSVNQISNLMGSVPEQWKRSVKVNTNGGAQNLLALSEQGLYFFVCRSDKPKAIPFQMWLAGDVLPSIRKTGKYELPRETISTEQQYLLRKAVERRCKNDSLHFQRVYHELYDRFKIPSYRDLLKSDFEEAMAFLEAEDLLPGGSDVVAPETPPKGGIYLTADETQTVANCVYLYRYLFRDRFFVIFQVLKTLNSPLSAELYEAFNNLSMIQLEHSLEKKGVKVPKPQQNLIM